jgi:hypothetical protein
MEGRNRSRRPATTQNSDHPPVHVPQLRRTGSRAKGDAPKGDAPLWKAYLKCPSVRLLLKYLTPPQNRRHRIGELAESPETLELKCGV